MDIETFYIETARLILRPYQEQDEEAVFKVVSQELIYKTTLMIPHPYPRENTRYWIDFTRKSIVYGCGYELGIFNKNNGRYLGNVGVAGISKKNNHGELAYFIDSDYWQQGYATEAVGGILKFSFETLGLERILGRCMTHNTASRRVMEKNGLLFEGIARNEVIKEGKYLDIIRLAILSQDYQKRL